MSLLVMAYTLHAAVEADRNSMPTEVFFMVLGAALVHASWNALVKTDGDRLSLIKLMSATQTVVSVGLMPFVAVPPGASWPYLLASSVLNLGYILMLGGLAEAVIDAVPIKRTDHCVYFNPADLGDQVAAHVSADTVWYPSRSSVGFARRPSVD